MNRPFAPNTTPDVPLDEWQDSRAVKFHEMAQALAALTKRIAELEARIVLTNSRLESMGEWVSKHTTG